MTFHLPTSNLPASNLSTANLSTANLSMSNLPTFQQKRRYRLGVATRILGAPLRSHDSRRWQNQPHLTVSLAYVRDILSYLQQHQIAFYRLAGQLAPYLTHPRLPAFHAQIEESRSELANTGDLARQHGIRLSMHPGHYIQLSSPDPGRVERSLVELEACAALLHGMGLDTDAVIVIHVGGRYAEKVESMERFVRNLDRLSGGARQRVALENDDRLYDVTDLLWLHKRTGIRLVFDYLHHRCLNRKELSPLAALTATLETWPADQQPKVHFSSPRTELRHLYQQGERRLAMPLPNQHSDFVNPFEFIDLLQAAHAARLRPFDIMLEVKANDLALLRLRAQLQQFAPELVASVY